MDSRDKIARKNIGNILNGLGFKNTPESRKLDPWMIAVLKRQEQQQEQEEACSSQKPSVLPPKKRPRPFIDLDSKNNDGEFVSKRSKKFKKQRTTNPALPVQKELPLQLKNMILEDMGGSDLMFVFEKVLQQTDLSKTHCRLTIPEKQVANEFLNNEEKRNVRSGIDVKLVVCDHDYEPSSPDEIKVKDINLIKWALKTTYTYALNKEWNSIVKEYKLQKHMVVQLWAFRVQTQLYFALVKL